MTDDCENCKWNFEDDNDRRVAIVAEAKYRYKTETAETNKESNLERAKTRAQIKLLRAKTESEIRIEAAKAKITVDIAKARYAWHSILVWALFWVAIISISIYTYVTVNHL